MINNTNFWSLDHVAACGFHLDIHGKRWHFKPLTFRDKGKIYAMVRSMGLQAYFDASKDRTDIKPMQRSIDVNGLAFGSSNQVEDLSTPLVQHETVKLSLIKSHADITDEQVDMIIRTDDYLAYGNKLLDFFNYGPFDPITEAAEAKGPDPTDSDSQSDTTTK